MCLETLRSLVRRKINARASWQAFVHLKSTISDWKGNNVKYEFKGCLIEQYFHSTSWMRFVDGKRLEVSSEFAFLLTVSVEKCSCKVLDTP